MGRLEKIQRFLSLVLVSVLALGMLLAMRPLPQVTAEQINLSINEPSKVDLSWPPYGQAAIGADGFGVLEEHGEQKPVPIASVSKLVTALTVLNKLPLEPGEHGPELVLTENDAALYPDYLSRQGSVIPVAAGQRISQYKALEAMLVPSANNIADSLAIWTFGSMDNYIQAANSYLRSLGFKATSVADASGFSPQSVSTAGELVRLGIIAMQNPVLAGIVGQSEIEVASVGTVNNTNWLLGQQGIVGIKTGNTEQAGGCYLFAAKHSIGDKEVMIVGAFLGAIDLYQAMTNSQQILADAKNGFKNVQVLKKGQVIGNYSAPWRQQAEVTVKNDLELIVWQADDLTVKTELKDLSGPLEAGSAVGSVEVKAGLNIIKAEAVLKNELKPPTPSWRLLH